MAEDAGQRGCGSGLWGGDTARQPDSSRRLHTASRGTPIGDGQKQTFEGLGSVDDNVML